MKIPSAFLREKQTLRRKLFIYMFTLAAALLCTLVAFLFLFGRFESTENKISDTLLFQQEVFEREMTSYYNEIAVISERLSENASYVTEKYFLEENISFSTLKNNARYIETLEDKYMELLRQELLKIDCSGAFIILNTSRNTSNSDSRAGVYIDKDFLGSDRKDAMLLFRGTAQLGREKEIMPHRKWKLEFDTSAFPGFSEALREDNLPIDKACRIHDMINLPGTSERVMLVSVPFVGADGKVYGICGFEVSESLFKSIHAQPTTLEHLICVFSKRNEDTIDIDNGLSCGVNGGYYLPPKANLTAVGSKNGLVRFSNEYGSYLGLTKNIPLYYESADYAITVMIPKGDYSQMKLRDTLQILLVVFLLLFSVIIGCLYFSKKYISPILKGLEKIKKSQTNETCNIAEIDDLFEFLSRKDSEYEKSLAKLSKQNEQAKSEISRVQTENERLASTQKKLILQDDYEFFLMGLRQLTPTEKAIFDLYLDGKTAAEIMDIMTIKQTTLKYHNRNIYSKLGVSSKKQLLNYAALYAREKQ